MRGALLVLRAPAKLCILYLCLLCLLWQREMDDRIAFSKYVYMRGRGIELNHGVDRNPFRLTNLQEWFRYGCGYTVQSIR